MYVITAARANELRQESNTQAAPLSPPAAPTSLTGTTNKPGTVILEWITPTDFVDESDDVEVWASDDNNRANAEKIYISPTNNTASGVKETFSYTTAGAGTKFYWVRTRRLSKFNRGTRYITSAYHPTSATGGVTGTSTLPTASSIDINQGAILINFNSSGQLTPSGTGQDAVVTVTKTNLTATAVLQILDTDESSQSDVQWTTGATSITADTATLDASTFDSNSTAKLIKATVTEGGTTYTKIVPIGITKEGSSAAGDDGLRTIQGYLYYEKSSSPNSAPSAPSGNTYTFSTGVVTGTGISTATNQPNDVWLNSFNTANATSANVHYTVRYYGTESSAGSNTISVAYSNVVQHTSFTGVTFSGGTFATVGGSNITTIDGANIDTGTITADRIKLSGTGSLAITSLAGALPIGQGGTGSTSTSGLVTVLNAAGLTLTSSLSDSATETIANIRSGTTKGDVGLGSVVNADTTLATQFTTVTRLASGSLFLGITSAQSTNYVEISAANGGQIIIADDS